MTIYFINNRPHIAVHNHFQEISHYDYYMMLEQNEIEVQEVELYD